MQFCFFVQERVLLCSQTLPSCSDCFFELVDVLCRHHLLVDRSLHHRSNFTLLRRIPQALCSKALGLSRVFGDTHHVHALKVFLTGARTVLRSPPERRRAVVTWATDTWRLVELQHAIRSCWRTRHQIGMTKDLIAVGELVLDGDFRGRRHARRKLGTLEATT